MSKCPCAPFELDHEDEFGEVCACGHRIDEHDEWQECQAEYVDEDVTP